MIEIQGDIIPDLGGMKKLKAQVKERDEIIGSLETLVRIKESEIQDLKEELLFLNICR